MEKRTNKSSTSATAKRTPSLQMGAGCLALFAIPFAGVGVLHVGKLARNLQAYHAAQSWEATPATLLQATLKQTRDGDGTTYRATARYRYEFNGKAYESDRIALRESSDNVGSFQRDRGKELQRMHQNGQAVTAYVNPADPTQAMLFRDLRPEMLAFEGAFALLFGGVGFGMIGAALLHANKTRYELKRSRQFPDEPWLWKDRWQQGRIRSSNHAWPVLFFAAFWNLITWPIVAFIVYGDDRSWFLLAFISIFLLIGAALAGWAGYLWLQRWKWGVSEFEMTTIPGVLGGPLAGVIHVPRRIRADSGVNIRLVCEQSVPDGDGHRTTTLWEEERIIVRDLTVGGVRTLIPVELVIPHGLPDSDADGATWKLSAAAKTSGVDYNVEFDVPIFKTAASSPTPAAAALEEGVLFAPITLATIASGAKARIEEDSFDRKSLLFPVGRQWGMSAFLTLFAIGWLAVSVWLFYDDVPWFIPWINGALAAVVLPLMMATALESCHLEFGARGVSVTRRIAGFGKERRFVPQEIASVAAVDSRMSYGNTAYWHVELRDRQGKRYKLATAIPRRGLAERLAEEISAAVGLSQSRKPSEPSRMSLESELPRELQRE